MYKINWGKVGEEILKKRPKITQMFDMIKYPKVPKYQLKPLIPLKFKNQSTHSHNPKLYKDNPIHNIPIYCIFSNTIQLKHFSQLTIIPTLSKTLFPQFTICAIIVEKYNRKE